MSHVDTTSPITHVSLCAGYGGIDLGLKRAIPSLRTIAFSEIESFACANLVSKMEAGLLDPAPIWTDLKTFPWSEFHGCVDILSGGYPCQPFSAAGKRLGAEDPRHLWPHISAGIAAMRPGACFFENVEGHISLGLPDVLQDLAGMGYRTTWGIFSASEVGAPHQRKRVFILAHDQRQRVEELGWQIAGASQFDSAWNDGGDAVLADTERSSLARWRVAGDMAQAQGSDEGQGLQRQRMRDAADHCGATPWPSRPGEQQFAWEPPRVVADTISGRGLSTGSECRSSEMAGDSRCEESARHQQAAFLNNQGCDGRGEETGTLVDTKSQRVGQRSELCGEECGSRGALPWDVEQSGEVGGVSNASHNGLEIDSECAIQPAEGRGRNGNAGRVCSREAMGNAESQRPAAQRAEHEGLSGQLCAASAGDEIMADAQSSERRITSGADNSRRRIAEVGRPDADTDRQAQQPMGDPVDGTELGLGLAELSGLSHQELAEIREWMVRSDNRTDELRLLGNGVVPATAERAFRVLVGELMEHQP